MTKVVKYRCDKCGTLYDTEQDCLEHERSYKHCQHCEHYEPLYGPGESCLLARRNKPCSFKAKT